MDECVWTLSKEYEDEECCTQKYYSSCGDELIIKSCYRPEEINMRYCPFCGQKIVSRF